MAEPTLRGLAEEMKRLAATVSEADHERKRLGQALARVEVEQAQQDQRYARRDVTDERLSATATVTETRLAAMHARLDGLDKAISTIQQDAIDRERRADAKDAARRNIVYAGLVAGVVGLAGAAIQAGVLG